MYELLLIVPVFFATLLCQRIYGIRKFDHICLIYSIWLIASIFGYLYTTSALLYQGKGNITLVAMIYMILMLYITIMPMQNSEILNSRNYLPDNSKLIIYSMYVLAICAYLPFIENIVHLVSGNTMSTLGDNYEARELSASFDPRAHMSWLGARLNSVTLLSKYITPILLMNYLSTQNKKNKLVVIGLIMGIFNPTICMFNMGSRWVAIEDLLFFIFLFILYRNLFQIKIRRYIQTICIFIICIIIIGIISITIGRFGDSNYDLSAWLYRYVGEGFVNFATDMWYTDHTANGMHLFRTLYDNAIIKLNHLMGIRMYVFYTFIGDFYADWGFIGCIIICLTLSLLGRKIFSNKTYNIYNVFVCSMYCKIFLTGFTYIVYINTLSELIIGSIFFFICKCNQGHLSTLKDKR